jgi:hypothetical protein
VRGGFGRPERAPLELGGDELFEVMRRGECAERERREHLCYLHRSMCFGQ